MNFHESFCRETKSIRLVCNVENNLKYSIHEFSSKFHESPIEKLNIFS